MYGILVDIKNKNFAKETNDLGTVEDFHHCYIQPIAEAFDLHAAH